MTRALSFWEWVERRGKQDRQAHKLVRMATWGYMLGYPAPRNLSELAAWTKEHCAPAHVRHARRFLASWRRYRLRHRERVEYAALVADRAAQRRARGLRG